MVLYIFSRKIQQKSTYPVIKKSIGCFKSNIPASVYVTVSNHCILQSIYSIVDPLFCTITLQHIIRSICGHTFFVSYHIVF